MNSVSSVKTHYSKVNGTTLCWFEWEEASVELETILLVHATGFHARCWNPVVRRMPGRHIIALDMRGHGRSHKGGPYHWHTFGEDVTEFVKTLDLQKIVGSGHSMGGSSLTLAMANEPDRFVRAVLVDPVIMDPVRYVANNTIVNLGDHPVSRRKHQFTDAEAFYTNLEGRGSYRTWLPESLRDYCDYGLLPDGNGSFQLACPPDVEASIYLATDRESIHDRLADVTVPVVVLRAQERGDEQKILDFSKSPTWPKLAEKFAKGRDVYLPDLTHFMPMQTPDLVAEFILGKR